MSTNICFNLMGAVVSNQLTAHCEYFRMDLYTDCFDLYPPFLPFEFWDIGGKSELFLLDELLGSRVFHHHYYGLLKFIFGDEFADWEGIQISVEPKDNVVLNSSRGT